MTRVNLAIIAICAITIFIFDPRAHTSHSLGLDHHCQSQRADSLSTSSTGQSSATPALTH